MSDWQPPDPALVARFGAALPAGTEPRRMFGCPCAFAAGKLCAGVYGNGLILRLPAARRAELLAQPGVQPFVAQGRSMREYVLIDAAALPADAAGL
ncbi:MAG: TfoX/Sxy family protein, partial [Rhodocyclaceae bacterium]|nr:TfoX/Sxy family protein [Rhodocyclaceae bacterium]